MARRRLSRRQREVRRNRIILACVASLILILIIIIISVSVKSCSRSGKSDNNKETGAISEDNSDIQADSNNTVNDDSADTTAASSTAVSDNSPYPAPQLPSGNIVSKGTTSKGFSIQEIDGATYIDGHLIANKTYALPSGFIPTNPDQPVNNADRSSTCLDKTLMSAWNSMLKDASANGLNIYIASGYRSYNYQVNVYNRYVKSDGASVADTYSSRPGYSEHQTGLCFDLNSIEDSFQYTDEGKWVNDNCYKYGFCIRFPKNKDAYTGYKYESWHLRYVGVDLATKLYNNGDWLSLEEYFGISSQYPD